ncbi:hypothetical protein PHYPSEUDO_006649 [Phytophthora pseudosyringae]|uniref:Uncharacterized protein n=1 Tax=Phytophthora pseudosyringae TaxID=221518 RepID=A0A8T1WB21_9STRA|nr:hypothetical protein PHYPSEUDO_006649 [Phytophthora pseudosyringae]
MNPVRTLEADADSRAVTKRRHSSKELGLTRGSNTAKVSTTQKIRTLRAQVASMEGELERLQLRWANHIHDNRSLVAAQRCVAEKHAANQSDTAHRNLHTILRQQQLLFATLQTAMLHAPLCSSGGDLFEALHFGTQLGPDEGEREKRLRAHNERALTTLPSIVKEASLVAISKVQGLQTEDKPVLPLSQIDVTGRGDCTLISSVFVSDIPHTSLEVVYAAVLGYFDSIPAVMKQHFGIGANHRKLNDKESPMHYQRSSFTGPGASWTENNVVCSELTSSHGIVHIDAVVDDPLYPVSPMASSRYGICCLTISPNKNALTDETLSVTLRWVVVYRYNMLPDDPAVKEDLEAIRPILNGDLITASVCNYIRELQRGQRQISYRKSWDLPGGNAHDQVE